MEKIKLVKVEELTDALHPNNIEVGYAKEGMLISPPKIGEAFWVGTGWRTSRVTEIMSDTSFRTLNSVYKIIPLED